jgi:hypothetical protein
LKVLSVPAETPQEACQFSAREARFLIIRTRRGELHRGLALKRGKSVDFTGYWQRHIQVEA